MKGSRMYPKVTVLLQFLANHSEFFEGMFFGDFADRNKDEVELPTLAVDDFEYFLQAISAAALPLRRK